MTTYKFLRWYRGEDAGDIKRIELVEKWICLNVLEKKICKLNPKILMDEKSWRTWKSNQNIVMDEELVQNVVMDEELFQNVAMGEQFVKNFVMDAKIDPNVVMNLSIFKIGGWSILQPNNRKLLEELAHENEPWLLIRILSRDSFLMMQYMERHFMSVDLNAKELMPLSEDIHVTTQAYMQQHKAEWKHETPRRTYIVKRIYEDEIHEHSDGNFRRSDRNRVNTCGRQQVPFFSTVGESKYAWRTILEDMHRKLGREIG